MLVVQAKHEQLLSALEGGPPATESVSENPDLLFLRDCDEFGTWLLG